MTPAIRQRLLAWRDMAIEERTYGFRFARQGWVESPHLVAELIDLAVTMGTTVPLAVQRAIQAAGPHNAAMQAVRAAEVQDLIRRRGVRQSNNLALKIALAVAILFAIAGMAITAILVTTWSPGG
jgi:hypothetical protein